MKPNKKIFQLNRKFILKLSDALTSTGLSGFDMNTWFDEYLTAREKLERRKPRQQNAAFVEALKTSKMGNEEGI